MSSRQQDICFLSAREMGRSIRAKEISAVELLTAHLDRIEQVNPRVNAIVTLVPELALEQARQVDEAVVKGGPIGPLGGLPVAFKDTHLTAGIRTTFGSRIRESFVPDTDELIVERLKAAGTITMGKTNVPEFAAGSHTFNDVFGVTRNPYDLDRSAGGSTGGSAAALACGMQAIADGSDMGGSLRNPASFCNVVGLRPSPGRVPSETAVLPWSPIAVAGPMARSVGDVALMLASVAGPDDRSPISLSDQADQFSRSLEADLAGFRVAWTPDFGGAVPVARDVVDTLVPQLQVFSDLGCEVSAASPDLSGADEVFRTLRAWQFDLAYGGLLDDHPDLIKPSLAWNIEQGRRLTIDDVSRAEAMHAVLYQRMRAFFEEFDILLAPVSQVLPFPADLEYPTEIDGVPQADYLDWMRSAYFISVTGCPALSVPAGFSRDGLPVGLQIIAPHRADLTVLQVGHMFESLTNYASRHPDLGASASPGFKVR